MSSSRGNPMCSEVKLLLVVVVCHISVENSVTRVSNAYLCSFSNFTGDDSG